MVSHYSATGERGKTGAMCGVNSRATSVCAGVTALDCDCGCRNVTALTHLIDTPHVL